MGGTTVTKQSYCRICPGLCGLRVSIRDNRIVGVLGDDSNPATGGFNCIKGRQNAEFHHAETRILSPMKRAAGGFERQSSQEALDEVASATARIIEAHGAGAVAMFTGTAAASNTLQLLMGKAFMRALGSPSAFGTMTVDQSAKWVAEHRIGKFASGRQSF